jgi:hypothetical protein
MRALHNIARLTALLVCCLLAAAAMAQRGGVSANQRSKPAMRAIVAHPEVDPAEACGNCHEAEYKQWNESLHATGGAPCLVCHGSVAANFARHPAVTLCRGCHAAQVESLRISASTGKSRSRCFICHDQHTLKLKKQGVARPHASVSLGGTQ